MTRNADIYAFERDEDDKEERIKNARIEKLSEFSNDDLRAEIKRRDYDKNRLAKIAQAEVDEEIKKAKAILKKYGVK